MWEWDIVLRSAYHHFVYMQTVTIQLLYNINKEIIIPTEKNNNDSARFCFLFFLSNNAQLEQLQADTRELT